MTEEIWKVIPGFPDYQISNLGRVKSFKRGKEHILKPRKNKNGYLMVNLCKVYKGKPFDIHRLLGLVFLRVRGNKEIDHINGIRTDNRLENLRPCTRSQNQHNRKININNTTGYPGVVVHKPNGKYLAQIQINGKTKYLGLFETAEEAFLAYRDASLELFGEFSPFVTRDEFKALSARVEALEGAV